MPHIVVLLLLALLCAGGCGRDGAQIGHAPRPPGREGHVYIAPLMQEHPLYPVLRSLDEEIAFLRGDSTLRMPLMPDLSITSPRGMILSLQPLQPFPTSSFAAHRARWYKEATRIQEAPRPTELAADLQAQLDWLQRRLNNEALRRISRLRSAEERRLAELRAKAVRERQEALYNIPLDLQLPDREAMARAEEYRRELWRQIEDEVAIARAEGLQQLSGRETAIHESVEETLRTLEAELWKRMEERLEISVKSGSKIRDDMSKALTTSGPLAWPRAVSWDYTGIVTGFAFPVEGNVTDAERETRLAQAMRLEQRRNELAGLIRDATERAVRKTAGMDNIILHIPPYDNAVGPDMTSRTRLALKRMYQAFPWQEDLR